MNADDCTVHRIEKRDGEEIRATLSRYKGGLYAHLRIYFRAEDGEWRPTQKGVVISAERFDELEEAVGALRRGIDGERKHER